MLRIITCHDSVVETVDQSMEAVSILIVIAANLDKVWISAVVVWAVIKEKAYLHQTTRDDHYVEATDNLLITLGIF